VTTNDEELPDGTERLSPEDQEKARTNHHNQLLALSELEQSMTRLRAVVTMTERACHRELADAEVVAVVRELYRFSTAVRPLTNWWNETQAAAMGSMVKQTPLGKLLAAELGITLPLGRVVMVGVVPPKCGPDGHHPDCPDHPDNLAKSQGPQPKPAGFQGPKKGEA
jgi:hypothetical protein